jgi:hypothetical protein
MNNLRLVTVPSGLSGSPDQQQWLEQGLYCPPPLGDGLDSRQCSRCRYNLQEADRDLLRKSRYQPACVGCTTEIRGSIGIEQVSSTTTEDRDHGD